TWRGRSFGRRPRAATCLEKRAARPLATTPRNAALPRPWAAGRRTPCSCSRRRRRSSGLRIPRAEPRRAPSRARGTPRGNGTTCTSLRPRSTARACRRPRPSRRPYRAARRHRRGCRSRCPSSAALPRRLRRRRARQPASSTCAWESLRSAACLAALDHAVRGAVNRRAYVQSLKIFHRTWDTMSARRRPKGARRHRTMRISTERILTTHVGSLPRSREVVELLYKKDRGEPFDGLGLGAAVAAGVADAVAKQVAADVDVVSDGETSKVGYATYIKDRLSGFAGHHSRPPHLDLAPYPELREALGRMLGKQPFKRAACVAPIELVDSTAVQTDLDNLRAALAVHGAEVIEAFVNAASPGVISAFQSNRYYASHDAYVDAIAAAMKPEYDAIVAAGFILQLDCPDLAMARHTGFQELGEAEFLARAEYQVEALNHAVRDISADRMRMHICWG